MKEYLGIALRAAAITVIAAGVGLSVNLVSPRPIPWIYHPRTEAVVGDVRIPFIDEKKARELFDDPATVIVDARSEEDFRDGHIRGAISLPEPELETRFPDVEPFLPSDARIILYCSGPDCDMAEKTAMFLAKLGRSNLMIMTSGYAAWKAAGYPVEGQSN